MLAVQIKRKANSEIHFLQEWGEIILPILLAEKTGKYESVRLNPKRQNQIERIQFNGNRD